MRYVTIYRSGQVFYMEEEQVLVIIEQPYIEKVPDGRQEVEGISCYNDKLVVYYKLGDASRQSCAVILNKGRGNTFTGIAGDAVGQEEKNSEELYEVMSGIWGEKNDKTDG